MKDLILDTSIFLTACLFFASFMELPFETNKSKIRKYLLQEQSYFAFLDVYYHSYLLRGDLRFSQMVEAIFHLQDGEL